MNLDITSIGKIELTRLGDSSRKRKLLCLHGGPGMDPSYFFPYLNPLACDAELIFYRQGCSGAVTIDALVDELAQVVKFFQGSEIFLFGHSFGGALALEYGKRFGLTDLAGLILVSWVYDDKWFARSLVKYSDFCNSLQLTQEAREKARLSKPSVNVKCRESFLDFVPLYFTPKNHDLGQRIIANTEYNGELFFSVMGGYLKNFDLLPFIQTISIPTLSILGKEDGVVSAEYIRAGLAGNCRMKQHEISNVSHFPFIEDTDQFISVVKAFVNNKGESP